MDIASLYEGLKKHLGENTERDNLFYDAPEGDAQIDIVRQMLGELLKKIG